MKRLLRKVLRAAFNYDPSFCDMYESEGAHRAAQEYLEPIRRHLHQHFGDRRLTILDAGCQAGRLLIPLAREGHQLIGIDTSGFALRRARQHAKARRLTVRFARGTIADVRRWVKPSSVDAVMCTEVLYLCEEYRTILERLAETVKPNGLLCISHRPLWYYVAIAVKRGQPEQASSVLGRTEGPSPDGTYHNWQTPEQLQTLYRGLRLRPLQCYPVNHLVVEANGLALHPSVVKALEPLRQHDSTFRVPSYLLVIAQKMCIADER